MKTIRKGEEIKRVSDKEAELSVKNYGYEYCPKTVWKTEVRNVAPKGPSPYDKPNKRRGKKLSRADRRELKNEK